jgi:hypothetical protein
MATTSVTLRSIPDTEATIGWSGGHSVVVDRPGGRLAVPAWVLTEASCLASPLAAASAMTFTTWRMT